MRYKMALSIVFAVFAVPCLSGPALALDDFKCLSELGQAAQKGLLASIEDRYQKFSDLKAEFVQHSYFIGVNQQVQSKGQVFFKKPGMMDWIYQEPDKQRFVTDGQTLWFHQPDLNQVTMGDFKQAFDSDLPVSFLLGVGHLQERFTLRSACRSKAGDVLNLVPAKPDPNLEEFYLLVDKETRSPIGAKIVDLAGNETAIVFHELVFNLSIPDKQFLLDIPKGADIIDNRKKDQKTILPD